MAVASTSPTMLIGLDTAGRDILTRISHVNPSAPVESGPKSFNVQVLCVLQSTASRYHGIERQWDVVAFDIAGLAALRTHLSRYGLA
ncbi:MAG: hypothetical protein V3T53_07540 [Phycisphaerales bacterium]